MLFDDQILNGTSLLAVTSDNQESVFAYSKEKGGWKQYRYLENANVIPVVDGDVLACAVRGREIKELAAYSGHTGSWHRQPLMTSTKHDVNPIVRSPLAIFQVNDHIYAFSALSGAWDVLRIPKAEKPRVGLEDVAIVKTEKRIHVFSAKTGRWDSVNLAIE